MNGNLELVVTEKLQLLEKEYTAVAMTALATLNHSKVPTNYVCQHILNLPYHKKSKYKKLVEKKANGFSTASMEEVFLSFSPYCDFFNPDMLELIVERFGDETSKAIISMYISHLSSFRKKTTLDSIVDKWVAITPPGYVELSLEVDRSWRRKTLRDLETFRSHVARVQWFLKRVIEGEEGNVVVVFSVPKGVWLYQEDLGDLRTNKILQVLEEGRCVVDLGQQLHIARPIPRTQSLESYLSDDKLNQEWREDVSYTLPKMVQFGFHRQAGDNIFVSRTTCRAMTVEPNSGSGFAYSAIPLTGQVEFEVRLLDYSGCRNTTLKLGLLRRRIRNTLSLSTLPKASEHRDNSCLWFKSRYKKKSEFQNNFGMVHLLRFYGFVDLTDLRQEDKIGLQLSRDGNLSFFVNGMSQGVAAHGIYQPGFEIYCFVELVEGYKAVEVTRAVMEGYDKEDIATTPTSYYDL